MSHVDDGKLHTYLDGECGERERQQIEDHLAGCEVCRERLDEARMASQSASGLLAELEPSAVPAPPWSELEHRAAARQQSTPRKAWVRPGMAWAAVMALAFGVGWLSNSYMSLPPEGFSTSALQEEAPASDLARQTSEAMQDAETPNEPSATPEAGAVGEENEGLGEGAVGSGEGQLAAHKRTEPAPAERTGGVAADRAEEAEQLAAELQSDDRLAAAPRRDRDAEPVDELKAEAAAERGVANFADRETPEIEDAPGALAQPSALRAVEFDEASPGQFVDVSPDDAAAWMGTQLRTLPELQLVSTEVGPGIAVAGGLSGLPAIKLTYLDAAGHVIVLVQQRTSEPELLTEDSDPTLIVDPAGLNAYRWHDDRGYRLMLLGEVSGDSLRALADRVR